MEFQRDVIDSHMHIYKWFDSNGKSYIENFDEIQAETGVKGMSIAALVDCIHGGVEANIMAAIYKLHNPSAYALANLFYPEYPVIPPLPEKFDLEKQYDELMKIGFDGFKILYKPDLQKKVKLPINDSFFDTFFSSAEKDGTYILWHVADPKANWTKDFPIGPWNYADGTFPTREEMYEQTFDVLKKHPKLNVCFAHFFFMEDEPEKLEELFDKYENLCVDVVPGLMFREFEKKSDFFRAFLTKYADRIVYGSDSEVPKNPKNVELMSAVYNGLTADEIVDIWGYKSKGIKLPPNVCDRILCGNFKNRCGETPKPVNKKALKAYIEKYIDYVKCDEERKQILEFLKKL